MNEPQKVTRYCPECKAKVTAAVKPKRRKALMSSQVPFRPPLFSFFRGAITPTVTMAAYPGVVQARAMQVRARNGWYLTASCSDVATRHGKSASSKKSSDASCSMWRTCR